MKCPVCTDQNLMMSDRQGVEIDYCPSCRGVWLDRGELDKIIERSGTVEPKQNSQREYFDKQNHKDEYNGHRDSRYSDKYYQDGYKKKKKEGFLSELFDF
ncbi:zf-TFIIB domain-containing protein [Campylobacter fetus]|uniref:Transcription factor zinc-finger domain-containing protein n=1 Tax=Campylobacter fetus subsp. testudinum TaxID=1507806 RepID=A0AAX0HDT9_CAMFE|nr:zf-TFIIB domain-containing protein [Campylobacter fetus]AGZ82115.1 putative protein, putative transcriptional regulator (zinc finger domain) [Campylobacter fetus subsp. testudinum 03-427]AJB45842.1 hypothetical protein CR44_06365 [Campylobacter fetus subsp. testudinum]ALV65284.1 hypothetical protein, putative transcriptional regulator (zinc finger domain) [Campylobacter fetus subsp. testudinum Sp3]AVK81535.1 hypothetical protein C6B32_06790 [Campylobacter fetus subsp. testudinum]EAI4321987.